MIKTYFDFFSTMLEPQREITTSLSRLLATPIGGQKFDSPFDSHKRSFIGKKKDWVWKGKTSAIFEIFERVCQHLCNRLLLADALLLIPYLLGYQICHRFQIFVPSVKWSAANLGCRHLQYLRNQFKSAATQHVHTVMRWYRIKCVEIFMFFRLNQTAWWPLSL